MSDPRNTLVAGVYDAMIGAPFFFFFFSGFEPEVDSRLERDEVVSLAEPEGAASFQWVLAQR